MTAAKKYVFRFDEAETYKLPPPCQRRIRLVVDPDNVEGSPITLTVNRYEPGQESPYHSHVDSCELNICLSGKAKIDVEGKEYVLEPGVVLFTPPGVKHKVTIEKEPCEFILIFVGLEPSQEGIQYARKLRGGGEPHTLPPYVAHRK